MSNGAELHPEDVPTAGVPVDPVEILSASECWDLLDDTVVGRIAVDIAGQPDIFPINYVVHGNTIVFRSGAGTKLAGAVLGRHVAFEIDGISPDDRTAWSVVVKGTAREITHMSERFATEGLPLYPWIATPKPNFVRIEPSLVTGRRFRVLDAVDLEMHAPHDSATDQAHRDAGKAAEGWRLAVLPEGQLPYHRGQPKLRPD